MKKLLIFCIAVFASINSFSQDIIILKTGDEIKSKVLEVTPDLVKYKKWENQDGPAYSTNKSDIFMIKYVNGTKDVFNSTPVANSNPVQYAPVNDGSMFVGTWYHKRYDGSNNQTVINISRAVDNYLVEYKVHERVDQYFYSADGSFKEVGHLENGSIVINSMIKLSLLNEYTLLMGSKEFKRPIKPKPPVQPQQTQQPQNSNSEEKPIKKSTEIKVQNNRVPLK